MAASAFTTRGLTYYCASLLTNKRIAQVAADYQIWLTAQVTQATAQDALLAAAASSKSPTQVLANAARYYAAMESDPPTITSITPNTGGTGGGTAVSIHGTNLNGATVVTFGGTTATAIVITDTLITCVTPAKTAGAQNVIVTTPAGSVTSTGGFTYA